MYYSLPVLAALRDVERNRITGVACKREANRVDDEEENLGVGSTIRQRCFLLACFNSGLCAAPARYCVVLKFLSVLLFFVVGGWRRTRFNRRRQVR